MRLHSYNIRAQDVCRWPRFAPDALVYGVEIEMEPRANSSQTAVLNALGEESDNPHFFCKHDGSLRSGVELVTVPMTLEQHQGDAAGWRRIMRPVLPIAMSGSRTSRCGCHVHVNKGALSNMVLAKLLLFLNSPTLVDFVASIAQRKSDEWARPCPKDWGSWKYPHDTGGRYQPLNVTRFSAEFRIFRGSIRWERIIKNVEFCDALVHYCRETSAAQFLDSERFLSYVADRAKVWPHLFDYMTAIGLYNPTEV